VTTPRLLKGIAAVMHPPTRAVVTVGVFDGVHLAHQQLIRSTIRLARRLKGTSVAVTFDPESIATNLQKKWNALWSKLQAACF